MIQIHKIKKHNSFNMICKVTIFLSHYRLLHLHIGQLDGDHSKSPGHIKIFNVSCRNKLPHLVFNAKKSPE